MFHVTHLITNLTNDHSQPNDHFQSTLGLYNVPPGAAQVDSWFQHKDALIMAVLIAAGKGRTGSGGAGPRTPVLNIATTGAHGGVCDNCLGALCYRPRQCGTSQVTRTWLSPAGLPQLKCIHISGITRDATARFSPAGGQENVISIRYANVVV